MLLFCSCSCFFYRRAKSHFYRLGGQAYIKLAIKNSKMKMDQFPSGCNEERGKKSLTLKQKTGRFQRYLARIFWILTQGSRVDINMRVKWNPCVNSSDDGQAHRKKVMVFFKVYRYGYNQQWQSRKMPDDWGPFLFSLPHTSEVQKMAKWKKFQMETSNAKLKNSWKFISRYHKINYNQVYVRDKTQVLAQMGSGLPLTNLARYPFYCRTIYILEWVFIYGTCTSCTLNTSKSHTTLIPSFLNICTILGLKKCSDFKMWCDKPFQSPLTNVSLTNLFKTGLHILFSNWHFMCYFSSLITTKNNSTSLFTCYLHLQN